MAKRKKNPPHRWELTDRYIRDTDEPITWDTKQIGLVLRVRPGGAKTFTCIYYHQARPRWYTIDRYGAIGLKEAREIARQIRAKAALGQDPQGDKMSERIGDTLEQVHESYLDTKARVENKSWKQSANLMKRYVLPTLGKRKIKEISHTDMWRIFDGLNDRPALANSVLASASAVFKWALKRKRITEMPTRGIELHKFQSRNRFLSNDEIRAVWPLFDNLGLYRSSALKVVLLTAQRPGEVCAMRWEHVDMDAAMWSMPGAASSIWPGTKNKRDHEIPLTEPVLELLADLDPEPQGYVFPSATKRGKHISIPSVRDIWPAAGISQFQPHDLRATASTGMDALGITRQYISLVLNHVEGGTTAGYVRHDQRQHKRRALEAWATELMLILEGKGRTDQRADVIALELRA